MGHELVARGGALPSVPEIARLLSAAFRHVRIDPEAGLQRARAIGARLERANPVIFQGHHREALEHAQRLKSLTLGEALEIEFGDDAERTLQFLAIPGEGVRFGYGSSEEEAAKKDLLERCAAALGCEIELF